MIKKFKNLIDINEIEVKFTIILTTIFIFMFLEIDIYNNFNDYKELINRLFELLIGPYIGLIGLMLAGLSIILNMLNSRINDEIKVRLNGIDFVEEISFDFIMGCIIIVLHITYILFTIFLINSKLDLVQPILFYNLLASHIYLFFFIISYSVALIYNCYQTFLVANNIEGDIKRNLEDISIINETKIDLIIKSLSDNGIFHIDDYINEIINYINASDLPDGKRLMLIRYIKEYYNRD